MIVFFLDYILRSGDGYDTPQPEPLSKSREGKGDQKDNELNREVKIGVDILS